MSRSGLLWVFGAALLTMAANLLFRLGIDRGQAGLDAASSWFNRYVAWFLQPVFVSGILFYGLAAIVWFKVVATEPLSSAYPVLVGLTFLLVITGAIVLFGETFGVLKVLGSGMILIGILLISRSA